jgi:hypothetical protein
LTKAWDVLSMVKGGPSSGGGVKSGGGVGGGSGVRRLRQTELVRGYLASRIGMWFCFLATNERRAMKFVVLAYLW